MSIAAPAAALEPVWELLQLTSEEKDPLLVDADSMELAGGHSRAGASPSTGEGGLSTPRSPEGTKSSSNLWLWLSPERPSAAGGVSSAALERSFLRSVEVDRD